MIVRMRSVSPSRIMLLAALLAFGARGSSDARAETYLVNPQGTGDFPNLETALEQVVDGDVIELADGTYSRGEGFDFLGKAITVRSQNGNPENCKILYDSNGLSWSGFTFQSGEGSSSILQGLLLTAEFSGIPDPRARGCFGGAGVSLQNGSTPTLSNLLLEENPVGVIACDSSPHLQDCSFNHNNIGLLIGGSSVPFAVASCTFDLNMTGINCQDAWGTITGCVVTRSGGYSSGVPVGWGILFQLGSTAEMDSCRIQGNNRGMMIVDSQPTLTNCLITGNGDAGPAVDVNNNSSVTIRRSTIASNSSYDNDAGGLKVLYSSTVQVEQSIIWGNCANTPTYADIFADPGSTVTMTCCLADSNATDGDVQWLGTNIFGDPYFTEFGNCEYPSTGGNYCPAESSPAWSVPGCGNLGAVIENCTTVSVTPTSWGQIKALYR